MILPETSITFPALLLIEGIYIFIARKFKPCLRKGTAHPVTGGGIIFIIALWLFVIFTPGGELPEHFGYIAGSATVLAIVGFIDDMYRLSPWLRLFIQTAAVAIPMALVPVYPIPWIACIAIVFAGVAFINAYNFMDGINGMTAAYSAVTLLTIGYCAKTMLPLPDSINGLSTTMFVAAIVFGFFNFRRNELAHCGDAGSVVMGFIILYLILSLISATGDWSYAVLVCVYGIDTGYTLIYRLFHGQNVLKGHRLHLYQLLDSRKRVPHLYISAAFAIAQAAINIGLISMPREYRPVYAIAAVAIAAVSYAVVRREVIRPAT